MSTKADSLASSRTTRRTTTRVSKLALFRVKVATVVVSMAVFVASLVGIVAYNPALGNEATEPPVQAQQITLVKSSGTGSLLLAPPPRITAVRPLVRSRGS